MLASPLALLVLLASSAFAHPSLTSNTKRHAALNAHQAARALEARDNVAFEAFHKLAVRGEEAAGWRSTKFAKRHSTGTVGNATRKHKGTKTAKVNAVVAPATADEEEVCDPGTVFNSTALWYSATGQQSACYTVNTDTDLIIGISTLLWSNTGVKSPLCGESVTLTNLDNGKTLKATVGDSSGKDIYTTLSKSAFSALADLNQGMFNLAFEFDNATVTTTPTAPASTPVAAAAAAPAAPSQDSTPTTPAYTAPSPVDTPYTAALNDVGAAAKASAASAAAAAASSAAADAAAASSSSSAAAAASSAADAKASSDAAAKAAKAQKPSPAPTPAPPAQTPTNGGGGGGEVVSAGAVATFFYQNGVAGACGTVHSEEFLGIAIDIDRWDNGNNCWKFIEITRVSDGAKVTAQVVDQCPTCNNGNSLDLSVGAFNKIASPSEGLVGITWKFV